jgi:phage gp36-like protein
MSAYCTTSDIEAEIKALDLSASNAIPTTAQVTAFIDQESARIDSYLTTRYDTPITGTESLLFLKVICISLVAWRVSEIISTRKTQQLPNGMISQDVSLATAYKRAIKDLEALRKGDMSLPDEDAKNSAAGKSLFASDNLDNSYEANFDVGTKQW